uniref:Uncharacterized protein n=1 Tax=Vitis vinifera TaxID=29760 RepID=A5BR06_VITVI|nr:hypothetical protein VITISV_040531 [Vitis vinifera]
MRKVERLIVRNQILDHPRRGRNRFQSFCQKAPETPCGYVARPASSKRQVSARPKLGFRPMMWYFLYPFEFQAHLGPERLDGFIGKFTKFVNEGLEIAARLSTILFIRIYFIIVKDAFFNVCNCNRCCILRAFEEAKCDLVPIKDEMNWEEKFERILE